LSLRIAAEFGSADEFSSAFERAMARGGERGATLVAALDRGDLLLRIPREDGPSWNCVPLLHVDRRQPPAEHAWRAANQVIERLERYR